MEPMFINHSSKQVTAKIVYYGPGLSGKTTNLQYVFSVTNPQSRGELVSIETDIERTLFFDLLPINVGLVAGYQTKFQLYTVPGQVFYDSTRRLVLKGADGIVFVADSQDLMEDANMESLENLQINLKAQNQELHQIPLVFQYNKRDLKNILEVDSMNSQLNQLSSPFFAAVATKGNGVIETLREISSLTLKKIRTLLDQSLKAQNIQNPSVNFDMNQKHEIIKREELPVKKIQVTTTTEGSKATSTAEATPPSFNSIPLHENEEVFELAGFENLDVKDLAAEFEEDTTILLPATEKPKGDSTAELDESEMPFNISSPPEPEPAPLKVEPPKAESPKAEPPKTGPPKAKHSEPAKTAPEFIPPEIPKKEPKKKKTAPSPPAKSGALDLLDKLKDDSRLTVIKKLNRLPENNAPITIEIKGNNTLLLDPIEVQINPKTKKVTLILDVKK